MIHSIDTHDAIFLLVAGSNTLAGQLALLADRDKRSTEPHGDNGSEEEAARIEADHDIDFLRGRRGDCLRGEMIDEVGDQCLERDRVTEDREDIQEDDALARK